MKEHVLEFRVRYQETDGQGRVHHANYLTFFEMGRTEQMRAAGMDYRDMERDGFFSGRGPRRSKIPRRCEVR